MLKRIFFFSLLLLPMLAIPFLVSGAQDESFALAANGPNGQKTACVHSSENSVMAALRDEGFNPKLDDSGFIYSLIGYDGPKSSSPDARQAFWSFWYGTPPTFSNLGPAQVEPQPGEVYVLSFGNGSAPTQTFSYKDICQPASVTPISNNPAPVTPVVSVPTSTVNLTDSFTYLHSNYSSTGASGQDWAAMALGAFGQQLPPATISSTDILSLSRNALARGAQNIDRTDEINTIKASYHDDQFGDPTLINDDIFAALAVESADPAWLNDHQAVFDTIIASQRSNGSFGFAKTGDGDVDISSAAVWVLVYKQPYPTDAIHRAMAFISSAQNSDGGYGFETAQPSNIASTSWAVLANVAVNISNTRATNYLASQKQSGGYWLFGVSPSYLNTAYAVMALSGRKMPFSFISPSTPQPVTPPTNTNHSGSLGGAHHSSGNNSNDINIRVSAGDEFGDHQEDAQTIDSGSCSASASASASASGNASSSASASASC